MCSVCASCGNAKCDCEINTKEMFSFRRLINSSMATAWRFLLLIKSTIKLSDIINTFRLFHGLYLFNTIVGILYITRVFNRIRLIIKVPSAHVLMLFYEILILSFILYGSLAYKMFLSIPG